MGNIFNAWKKIYSADEYEKKVAEYKNKLRNAALKANFGRKKVLVEKVCTKCQLTYLGNPNQIICNSCKENGYVQVCKHCDKEFVSNKSNSCCNSCLESKPWKNREVSDEQKQKFKISKKLWYTTEAGIAHREKMSQFNSDNMKRFNQTKRGKELIQKKAKEQSKRLKEKILNGTFTPKISNRRTHWDAKIKLDDGTIKKFRSSWEAVFWASNMYLEYETLRIPWTDKNMINHVYIADFIDRTHNIVYEIKPRSCYVDQYEKMHAAINYCISNNLKFIWINESNILNYIDISSYIFTNDINKQQLNKVINASRTNTNKVN